MDNKKLLENDTAEICIEISILIVILALTSLRLSTRCEELTNMFVRAITLPQNRQILRLIGTDVLMVLNVRIRYNKHTADYDASLLKWKYVPHNQTVKSSL